MVMETKEIVGVDLGGTNVHVARVGGRMILQTYLKNISAQADKETVFQQIVQAIKQVLSPQVSAIGVGVPGLVDLQTGTVYDLMNIPSWKEIQLKAKLEAEFGLDVFVNNDANCFALGELYFGAGEDFSDLVGLIIGTGLGAGIIFNKKLYNGANCGAGEFGMLPFLEHNYEYYASGQYFEKEFKTDGKIVFQQAQNGYARALKIFRDYGHHLGKALIAIVYSLNPQIIVLGGSVSKAFPFFSKTMWESLAEIEFKESIKNLKITVTADTRIPVLGAAALAMNGL